MHPVFPTISSDAWTLRACRALIPGFDVAIPTFAIAGMAVSIGRPRGLYSTGIVLLTEMCKDKRSCYPLAISCSVAYAGAR